MKIEFYFVLVVSLIQGVNLNDAHGFLSQIKVVEGFVAILVALNAAVGFWGSTTIGR